VSQNGLGIAGVLITLGGAGSSVTNTDPSGSYYFPVLSNGSYTITPGMAGYKFTPASLQITFDGTSITTANFTASKID
jgi:hypothetical protein